MPNGRQSNDTVAMSSGADSNDTFCRKQIFSFYYRCYSVCTGTVFALVRYIRMTEYVQYKNVLELVFHRPMNDGTSVRILRPHERDTARECTNRLRTPPISALPPSVPHMVVPSFLPCSPTIDHEDEERQQHRQHQTTTEQHQGDKRIYRRNSVGDDRRNSQLVSH